MRNEVRNSIILASLLIIIFIMRIVLSAGTAKQIKAENDLLAKNKAELASLQYIIIDTMQIYHIKQNISKLDSWQEQNGKSFVARDNSRKTWSYLNTIIQNYAPILDINFTNNGDDSDENSNHDYHITERPICNHYTVLSTI